MKKLFMLLIVGSAVFLYTSAWAGIAGSAHDFSGQGWNSSGEICITCHTPHNADTAEQPLWNHQVTTASYTLYTSGTLNSVPGQPAGTSKLCLSCHDGTVALDSYGGATGSTMISGSELLNNDLSNDHPVSFTYNDALATTDGGLHPPTTTNSGLGDTIDKDLLFSTKLECASCHDVHNADNNGDLLRVANTASALCLTCHNK